MYYVTKNEGILALCKKYLHACCQDEDKTISLKLWSVHPELR